MDKEIRKSSFIIEELNNLNDLNKDTLDMSKKYPDDYALKLLLKEDEYRRKRLLEELEESIEYEKHLTIKIDTEDHKIPINILMEKINAFQLSIKDTANAIYSKNSVKQKRTNPKELIDNCKILVAAFNPGSFEIKIEIENPINKLAELLKSFDTEEKQKNIKKELENKTLGIRSIELFKNIITSINENRIEQIENYVKNPVHRKRIFSSIEKLYQNETDKYGISISDNHNLNLELNLEKRNTIQLELEKILETRDVETDITGFFDGLSKDKNYATILYENRIIKCQFRKENIDLVKNLEIDMLIEIRGIVKYENSKVKSVQEISNVKILEMPKKTMMNKFSSKNKQFLLKKPVEYRSFLKDKIWIYECPEYGLTAQADSNNEAFIQLGEQFANLLQEDIRNLNDEEQEIRKKIDNNIDKITDNPNQLSLFIT